MIVYVIEPKNWAIIKTVDITSLDAPIFSNDNSSGTLVLPEGITPADCGNVIVTNDAKYAWVIMSVKPSDTNVTVTLGDIFNLFDRTHYYTQPSAGTSTQQFAYNLLNTQYKAISDTEYKFKLIDLAWSGSTNFIQPVCSDGNLFKASDYLRMIAQNGVKFEFAYRPRLSVTISERTASHTNLMFNDGHSQLISKEFASEITAKVTVYSGISSTNYYLQSNGSISTTAPTPRIKGKWAAINTTDDVDNAVRAVFAKNTNTQKFEFYSDKELDWNGEVWMLIEGERYKATISSIRINSDDVRYKYIAGDLATTLTEKLTQVQKPIQYGKANLDTNIMEYRPYWRILDSVGFVNAFATESFTGTDKPVIEAVEENGTAHTEKLYAALPFPMKTAVMVGATDRKYDVRGINGNGTFPVVGEEYRLYSPYGNTEGEAIPVNVRIHLMGMRADVPETPTIEADTSGAANKATKIAESYLGADIPFVYGKNWTYTSAEDQVLIGGSARVSGLKGGRMECDAFVDMILRGISYENSPYAENKAAVEADPFVPVMLPFEDMADYDNPDSLTWVSWLLAAGKLYGNPYMTGLRGGAVRWAQDLAWFMWSINDGEHACIFSDKTEARNGDFAFFKKADRETFDNISHVAYIGVDDGELYVYEVTVETAEHPTAVYKTKLSEYSRETAYFARLNYSAMTEDE